MKKVLSLALAFTVLLGLCMPTALAAEDKPTRKDFESSYSLDMASTHVECEPYYLERMDDPGNRHLPTSDTSKTSYNAIAAGTKFTLKNTAKNGNLELSVLVMPYSLQDGKYSQDVEPGGYCLREKYFQLQVDGREDGGKALALKPGQSKTFDFTFRDPYAGNLHTATATGEMIYVLTISGYYPDYDWSYWDNYTIIVGKDGPQTASKAKMDVSIRFTDDNYEVDNGFAYHYTLTNNTDAPIKKYAALVTYNPKLVKLPEFDEATRTFVMKENAQQVFYGQVHAIDIDLTAAGESVDRPIISNIGGLSSLSMLWLDFESLSERDAFLKDPILGQISTPDIQGYRAINMETGVAWMKNTLGITINPAK